MRYFIAGGAGFIGAHWVNRLLDTTDGDVTVFDDFSTGRRWAFGERISNPRLTITEGDVRDLDGVVSAVAGHDIVYHFAANSDIAKAAEQPDIDFWRGTYLTHNLLEAMRMNGVGRIVFTSGSGVYGDVDDRPVSEDHPRMIPISTYGASKLASESLISAYSYLFGMAGTVFRFANVVGSHQTHGVAFDFIRRLAKDPGRLFIYGDGSQSKPYIHVEDVLAAFALLERKQAGGYDVFNVATADHMTVQEIAEAVVDRMGLKSVRYEYSGGTRGWKADVPVYRLDSRKIRDLGWKESRNSRGAVCAAIDGILDDLRSGRLPAAP